MRVKMLLMLLLLVISPLLITSPGPAQTPTEPEKPLYKTTGNEATLIGAISVKGSVPKPRQIDMSADPLCVELNDKREIDWLLTNEGGLLNAFVYLKSGDSLTTYRFPLPDSQVELHHRRCYYSPHVVGLRVGQKLLIINDDPTHHNTHPTPKLNREWNQTQPPGAEPLVKTFSLQEVLIPFRCNQHPWEKAYVGVLDHPFFAVTDQFGNYEIRGLPTGTYTLVGWHERLGEQQMEITVRSGENRRVDFTFDAEKKP